MSSDSEASIWVGYNVSEIENEEFNTIYEDEGLYEACEHFDMEYPIHYDGADDTIVGEELYSVEWGNIELETYPLSKLVTAKKDELFMRIGQKAKVFLASEYF